MTKRSKYVWGVSLLAFAGGLLTGAQSPKPSKYEPTHEQYLELQVKQKDAIIAQIQFNQAQQAVQKSYQELDEAAARVKKANGWPAEIQFNQQTLTFAPAPQPATPPPPPQPAPEKKP